MKPSTLALCLLVSLMSACAATSDKPAPVTEPASDPPAPISDSSDDDPLADAEALQHWQDDYAGLLLTCVSRDGRVRYSALKPQRVLLNKLVTDLAPEREYGSPAQQQAHLINAYNLLVIAAIAQRQPPVSPGRIGGFFDYRRHEIDGEKLTLNQIRARAVALGDARTHLAMVQGAQGSPPLRARPYVTQGLDNQLNAQCQRFVNGRQYVTTIGRTVLVSSIFQWYRQDFEAAPFGSIRAFLEVFAEPGGPLAQTLAGGEDQAVIEMLEFNWALNDHD